MGIKSAKDIAKHINEDRQGAAYYKDPGVLAPYLQNSLNVSEEVAVNIARHIAEDRNGADYYQDTEILAQYLGGKMNG